MYGNIRLLNPQGDAADEALHFVSRVLAAKCDSNLPAALSMFDDAAVLADVALALQLVGRQELRRAWGSKLPNWGPGRYYADHVLGEIREGTGSCMLAVTNIPRTTSIRTRVLSCVDVYEGRIVRWFDYWDGICEDADVYCLLQRPRPAAAPSPVSYGNRYSNRRMCEVSARLMDLLSRGEAGATAGLFTLDAQYLDPGLRIRLLGRTAIMEYLSQVIGALPFGRRAQLGHVVGGAAAGGFEWCGSPQSPVECGAAALRLDAGGLISWMSVAYDARDLPDTYRESLGRPLSHRQWSKGRV